jgi:hypothetical protein
MVVNPYRLLVWFHTPSKFIESLATARSARVPSFLLFDVSRHPAESRSRGVCLFDNLCDYPPHEHSLQHVARAGLSVKHHDFGTLPVGWISELFFPIISGLEPVPLLLLLPVRIRVASCLILSMLVPGLQSGGSILVILFRT